jgi:hypothetical protein
MGIVAKLFTVSVAITGGAALSSRLPSETLRQRSSTQKRGAAYNDVSAVWALASDSGAISWAYNWDSEKWGDMPAGVTYVPMVKGANSFNRTAVEAALASGSTSILGFNEPDIPSQDNDMNPIRPADAGKYYEEYITKPYASQAELISPAVTSSRTPGEGLDWLDSFLTYCASCKISSVAVHWYGNDVNDFMSQVSNATKIASAHRIPSVWLTEFALNADVNGISNEREEIAAKFLAEAISWLDDQPEVSRYAYFKCGNGYLVTGNSINDLGRVYTGASSPTTSTVSNRSSTSTITEACCRLPTPCPCPPTGRQGS